MALLCFTLLVQLDSIKAQPDSNSRYLLIELEGSPNMDPGSDVTTELSKVSEMPEAEEEPSDDLEPETLPEDDVTAKPRIFDPVFGKGGSVGTYRSGN